MSAVPTHVIVGGGLAGAVAAETLRAEGFDGRVVLLGAEPDRPYERPPLSKSLLRGESPVEDAFVHEASWYREHDVDLRLGRRVTWLDLIERLVHLDDGEPIPYDRLLLATGARPRRLHLPGAGVEGIHHLRDLTDVRALRAGLEEATRVAVVGTGWIGTEVAASLRQLGKEVALIGPDPLPLAGLGPELGSVYRDLHARHGVELHLGEAVQGFVGDPHVTGVLTSDGRTVAADLVVVGVGAVPRLELAEAAGLVLDGGGIAVDDRLETSTPGVFAAGDVAAVWNPALDRRVRVEHWANARHQGATAARNMLGADEAFDRIPYVFSDQYDLGMELSGHVGGDRVVVRGDPAAQQFVAFWLDGNRVVAAMNANVWDVVDDLQAIIASGQPVEDRLLTDPHVPLATLAAHLRCGSDAEPLVR